MGYEADIIISHRKPVAVGVPFGGSGQEVPGGNDRVCIVRTDNGEPEKRRLPDHVSAISDQPEIQGNRPRSLDLTSSGSPSTGRPWLIPLLLCACHITLVRAGFSRCECLSACFDGPTSLSRREYE
ncbi:hypothetical protein [Azorhizophilus paspali]|uniref:Uncharacterized protein n=1 Tax=Azorhizophilus paspali TaxID=69963 RepID=A0ABV6SL13_AZOPA